MPLLHFEQPSVRIDNSVWVWLTKEKLDRMRLSTDSVVDTCQVTWETFSAGKSGLLVQYSDAAPDSSIGTVVHNVNTATEFRVFSRATLFTQMSESPESFKERVYLVTFADLKTYVFTYNISVPSLSPVDFSFECDSIDTTLSGSSEFCYTQDFLPYSARTALTRKCLSISTEMRVNIETATTRYVGVLLRPISTCRVVYGWSKWVQHDGSYTTIQSVDLKRFLDPSTIAREAVNLNVKLIKWRLIPSLDPVRMSSLRFLLLGAGTLGCAVARGLMAWGVENITLVDSGTVSYSNLARQWLYRLEDAQHNAPKAIIAAERLREILPSVNAKGVQLQIPLPGHPEENFAELAQTVRQLDALIDEADVVYMLTDSRESRWLPSVMVASKPGVLGVSVALGFDSYLVKTHSIHKVSSACYFCNDVSAPTTNTSFRTLDQQCTVTRPGIAAIASSVAVELVANLTQSDFGAKRSLQDDASLLGSTPDQVRGFLGSFTSFPAVTERSPNCVCCSDRVVDAYRTRGTEFVNNVVADSTYLMEISGMKEEVEAMDEHDLEDFCIDDIEE